VKQREKPGEITRKELYECCEKCIENDSGFGGWRRLSVRSSCNWSIGGRLNTCLVPGPSIAIRLWNSCAAGTIRLVRHEIWDIIVSAVILTSRMTAMWPLSLATRKTRNRNINRAYCTRHTARRRARCRVQNKYKYRRRRPFVKNVIVKRKNSGDVFGCRKTKNRNDLNT